MLGTRTTPDLPDAPRDEVLRTGGRSSSRRLALLFLALGAAVVAAAVGAGWLAYRLSLGAGEDVLRHHFVQEARLLAAVADQNPDLPTADVLDRLRATWHSAYADSEDEYLCVVDRYGRLLLHTAAPETVGAAVGANVLLDAASPAPQRLKDLVRDQVAYDGGYRASDGSEQVVAFAPVPSRHWVVGLHRATHAFLVEVHSGLGALTWAYVLLCAVVLPASLWFIGVGYRRALRERDRALGGLERSEGEHRRLLEESVKREAQHRSLLHCTPDAVAIYDLEGRAVYVNPAFTETFGFDLTAIEGRQIPFVPEEEKPATLQEIRKVLAGEPTSEFHTRRLTRDGRRLEIVLSSSCYYDAEGEPAGIVVLLRDVTDQKRTEEQLRRAQKMQAVGTLAGGVAHDFNNLLQVVHGFAELLAEEATEPPAVAALHEIMKAADRGQDLTRQLLAFSRRLVSRFRSVDLGREVAEAARLLERTLPKSVAVQVEDDEVPLPVHADPGQLQHVLVNLGLNAVHAMPGGGSFVLRTGHVSVEDEAGDGAAGVPAGDYAVVAARDTGIGMDEKTRERIFEPFFTTRDVGSGTGLGLAVVYGIVKSHDGYVTCTSTPGQGTEFRIFLPIRDGVAERTDDEPADAAAASHPAGAAVLLVDDEAAIRELGRELLEREGYTAVTAASGEEAIAMFTEADQAFDVAVVDLGMPGMGGQACIRELLAIDPSLKILVASGYASQDQADASLTAGAARFLPKPYRSQELLAAVDEALEAGDS